MKDIADILMRNGFELNPGLCYVKGKCVVTLHENYYQVAHWNKDFLEWMDWFSHDLNIYSLLGYLSYNDFIKRGYEK